MAAHGRGVKSNRAGGGFTPSVTGSPEAVARLRLPQNVACGCRDKNAVRAALSRGFPSPLFQYARWVHSSTIAHVSTSPPTIPDGRIPRVRFWPRHSRLRCDFCSSGQRFACSFLQIPPRDGHPCRPANTSPCRACRGLAPPSGCALPGAQIKGLRISPKPLIYLLVVPRVFLIYPNFRIMLKGGHKYLELK